MMDPPIMGPLKRFSLVMSRNMGLISLIPTPALKAKKRRRSFESKEEAYSYLREKKLLRPRSHRVALFSLYFPSPSLQDVSGERERKRGRTKEGKDSVSVQSSVYFELPAIKKAPVFLQTCARTHRKGKNILPNERILFFSVRSIQ